MPLPIDLPYGTALNLLDPLDLVLALLRARV